MASAFSEDTFVGFLMKFGEGFLKLLGGLLGIGLGLILVALGAVGTLLFGIGLEVVKWFQDGFWKGLAKTLLVAAAIYLGMWAAVFIGTMFALPALIVAGLAIAISYILYKIVTMLIPSFAKGGVASGGLSLVGEKGPELVNLPKGSRVHTHAQTRTMLGQRTSSGGNTINVHVNGRVGANDSEIRDIAKKVARHINIEINRTANNTTRV
jgi:hypothetical protein